MFKKISFIQLPCWHVPGDTNVKHGQIRWLLSANSLADEEEQIGKRDSAAISNDIFSSY
jgi:hypothetical protein